MTCRPQKTALFVAAEFPPIKTIGRLRATKFIEHLRSHGWRSVVLTIEPNGVSSVADPALASEIPEDVPIYRCPHPDVEILVASTVKRLLGRSSTDRARPNPQDSTSLCDDDPNVANGSSFTDRLHGAFKVTRRQLLDIPDGYNLWALRARQTAVQICHDHQVDLIFTTLPPFSTAWIGRHIKRRTGLPWVVDYRDLWTGDVLREWLPSWRQRLERRLERRVVGAADAIVAVSEEKMTYLKEIHTDSHARWAAITNGYDPEEFEGIVRNPLTNADHTTFTFTGRLFKNRRGYAFAEALGEISKEDPDLASKVHVRFLGGVATEIRQRYDEIIRRYGIDAQFEFTGDLSHAEAKQAQVDADYLLLIVDTGATSGGVIPGKLFEYVGAKRPIFALCDPGATAKIIEAGRLGTVVPAEDVQACKVALRAILQAPVPEKLDADQAYLAQFDRRKLAAQLADLFDQLVGALTVSPRAQT